MLRADDISEAVDAGVITESQARALEAFARTRRQARVFAAGREERFKLLGGFNDFFIALGVFLLGIGFQFSPGAMFGSVGVAATVLKAVNYNVATIFMMGVLIFWGLAELLTGRLKLVAPSIVIVGFLASLAFAGASMYFPLSPSKTIISFLAAVAVVALHYKRFGLPFSLFVLALTGVGLALALVNAVATTNFAMSPQAAGPVMRWAALLLGLVVFAWAMSFDTSDPERTSRRADCGFWLHLIAAPLIVHPLAGPLINHPLMPDYSASAPVVTGLTIVLVLALVSALSVVALIVDRRALLVAGLGYLGSALGYTISKWSGVSGALAVLPTLMFLGVLIITLGIGWRQIRTALMTALPGIDWKRPLPPYGPIPNYGIVA